MSMNCEWRRARWIEAARGDASAVRRDSELADHLEACGQCSRFLHGQLELGAALAAVAAEAASLAPPEDLEASVLAEFDRASGTSRRRAWLPAAAAALAASLVAAALLLQRPAPARRAAEAPFIEIPYVAPPAPYERTAVMRMDVPLAALIAAGFEVHLPDAGAAVRADVLVGQDGRALAIRFVPGSVPNYDRRITQ